MEVIGFGVDKDAIIDKTGQYRYSLSRIWGKKLPPAVFIMLNPSTADTSIDDPTILRCINFGKTWGYGRIHVVNVFAFRATDPKRLLQIKDPIGPENLKYIEIALNMAKKEKGIVIAAWGSSGPKDKLPYYKILESAEQCGIDLYCLSITKSGHPKHPLYIKGNTAPILFKKKGKKHESTCKHHSNPIFPD